MGFELFLLLAQALPWQTAAAESVRFEGPAQVKLARGRAETVELRFHIRDGLHINSHTPRDKSLIRTELVVAEPEGLDVQAVSFPPGEAFASKAFPSEKLDVYTGELVLHARLLAVSSGRKDLTGVLRYQACDADTCFPPKQAEVVLEITTRQGR